MTGTTFCQGHGWFSKRDGEWMTSAGGLPPKEQQSPVNPHGFVMWNPLLSNKYGDLQS